MTAKNLLKARFNALPKPMRDLIRMSVIPPLRAYVRHFPVRPGKQLLWDHVISHLWWMEGNVLASTPFDYSLQANANDIVGRYIYYFGVWEPNLTYWIKNRLRAEDVFVDVGANIGYFSLLASKCVGALGRVVAVEALPQTARILEENLLLNRTQNVRIANAAAWDQDGEVELFTSVAGPVGTTTVSPEWASQWALGDRFKVPAKPLYEILSIEEIRRARLIKIDVEGAEWQVVSGMEKIFNELRPDVEIILEVAPKILESNGNSCADLLNKFTKWGFFAYRIINDYSADAYLSRINYARPARIETIPTTTDQVDIVFSRLDSWAL